MNLDEVIKYFSHARVVKSPSTVNGETYFGLKTPSGETIYFYFYSDKAESPSIHTKKLHVLSLPSFKYQAAKDSL